eukprot:TRINITY_DN7209_c1_g1_i1.p1 TRINITY_DN7209_c1_g1~~TRINITY_DN7209_c1_g1_i1.p1  ORF type:complete len:515 (+),score=169.22 TRINITY_DN7209_c1_g1_i1:401-1945(+)
MILIKKVRLYFLLFFYLTMYLCLLITPTLSLLLVTIKLLLKTTKKEKKRKSSFGSLVPPVPCKKQEINPPNNVTIHNHNLNNINNVNNVEENKKKAIQFIWESISPLSLQHDKPNQKEERGCMFDTLFLSISSIFDYLSSSTLPPSSSPNSSSSSPSFSSFSSSYNSNFFSFLTLLPPLFPHSNDNINKEKLDNEGIGEDPKIEKGLRENYVSPLLFMRNYKTPQNHSPSSFAQNYLFDKNKKICKYELDGKCNNDNCKNLHFSTLNNSNDMNDNKNNNIDRNNNNTAKDKEGETVFEKLKRFYEKEEEKYGEVETNAFYSPLKFQNPFSISEDNSFSTSVNKRYWDKRVSISHFIDLIKKDTQKEDNWISLSLFLLHPNNDNQKKEETEIKEDEKEEEELESFCSTFVPSLFPSLNHSSLKIKGKSNREKALHVMSLSSLLIKKSLKIWSFYLSLLPPYSTLQNHHSTFLTALSNLPHCSSLWILYLFFKILFNLINYFIFLHKKIFKICGRK